MNVCDIILGHCDSEGQPWFAMSQVQKAELQRLLEAAAVIPNSDNSIYEKRIKELEANIQEQISKNVERQGVIDIQAEINASQKNSIDALVEENTSLKNTLVEREAMISSLKTDISDLSKKKKGLY